MHIVGATLLFLRAIDRWLLSLAVADRCTLCRYWPLREVMCLSQWRRCHVSCLAHDEWPDLEGVPRPSPTPDASIA